MAKQTTIEPIPVDQIVRREQVGTLDGDPVLAVSYIGGLHVVAAVRKNRTDTIAIGPHRAIAKFLAKKAKPSIVWTGLSKSDDYPYAAYAHLVPKWDAISTEARRRQGF